jgi:hypothetical protein
MTADYRILLDVPLKQNLALGFNELAGAFRSVIETATTLKVSRPIFVAFRRVSRPISMSDNPAMSL